MSWRNLRRFGAELGDLRTQETPLSGGSSQSGYWLGGSVLQRLPYDIPENLPATQMFGWTIPYNGWMRRYYFSVRFEGDQTSTENWIFTLLRVSGSGDLYMVDYFTSEGQWAGGRTMRREFEFYWDLNTDVGAILRFQSTANAGKIVYALQPLIWFEPDTI